MGFVRKNNSGGNGTAVNVKNTLTSTSTTDALSANQGRVLNEKIKDIQDEQIIQNERLDENESVDRRQNIAIDALFNENNDKRISLVNQETHEIKMDYSIDDGFAFVDRIEGDTLVNLCEQEDPITITKSYEVNSGNHIALQGEYDGKARPKVYGNTLVNIHPSQSYEFRYNTKVDADLVTSSSGINYVKAEFSSTLTSWSFINLGYLNMSMIRPNTKYTIIFKKSIGVNTISFDNASATATISNTSTLNNNMAVITTTDFINLGVDTTEVRLYGAIDDSTCLKIDVEDAIILEGDYTNKPIPQGYFQGMQSSFENQLVTQEMVDSGEELEENLGKYKVDVKVRGKNLFDGVWIKGEIINSTNGQIATNSNGVRSNYIEIPNINAVYTISNLNTANNSFVAFYNKDKNYISRTGGKAEAIRQLNVTEMIPSNAVYMIITQYGDASTSDEKATNMQIEEETQATPYEPYKEYTKTVYLNSPLLKDDTIEEVDGKVNHVHRYEQVVFDGSDDEEWGVHVTGTNCFSIKLDNVNSSRKLMCDKKPVYDAYQADKDSVSLASNGTLALTELGFSADPSEGNHARLQKLRPYLQANPVKIVYQLASPKYEIISDESILHDSYANGHLDFDSNVPVEKVVFDSAVVGMTYLYPNTKYAIQFESDNVGELRFVKSTYVDIDVVKGVNKFTFTTSASVPDNNTYWSGIGFNASKIQVVATELEFGYFKNMMSTFEDKVDSNGKYEVNVKIVSEDNSKEYATKVLLNSPLLKGDTVEVIDGRLVHIHKSIKRNVKDFATLFNGVWSYDSTNNKFIMSSITTDATLNGQQFSEWGCYDSAGLVDWGFAINANNVRFGNKFGYTNASQWTNYLANNDLFVIYGLKSYTREDITDIQVDEFKNAILLNSISEGTMIIDTALPVKTNITYSCNIPSVTTLRSNLDGQIVISDEQDMVAMENSYKVSMLEILTGVSEGDLNA